MFETALTEAGSTLGWTVESVTVDAADPVAVATAFDEAVAAKPAGIHIQGQHVDSLVDSLPAAETAGIPGRVHGVLRASPRAGSPTPASTAPSRTAPGVRCWRRTS